MPSSRRDAGYAHPWRLDPDGHALQRWRERWRSALTWSQAKEDLLDLLKRAVVVEIDEANLQAIWRLPSGPDGRCPLVVADATGMVKTVLPRDAVKPSRRPRRS